MSNIKSALKAAKAALDAKRYEEVIVQVNIVLGADPQNYFASVVAIHRPLSRIALKFL